MTRRLRAFLLDYAYPGNIRELRNIVTGCRALVARR